jgi:hypothetical protein
MSSDCTNGTSAGITVASLRANMQMSLLTTFLLPPIYGLDFFLALSGLISLRSSSAFNSASLTAGASPLTLLTFCSHRPAGRLSLLVPLASS